MVGTIAVFESILLYTPRDWTPVEKKFLDQGAKFLIHRKLKDGSKTKHNSQEQASANDWLKPCFPRFYLYDVLRGLNALIAWSEKTGQKIPKEAIEEVVRFLNRRFPDGQIRNERHSFQGAGTFLQSETKEWNWQQSATFFPLLQEVSAISEISPYLSKKWADAKNKISNCDDLKELLEN